MGLCYERLGQTKKAIGAFRQAWNTLLEQRDCDFERDAGNKGKDLGVKEAPRRDDDIGAILRQARAALGVEISDGFENEEKGASDSGGEPVMTGGPPSNTSEGRSTSAGGEDRRHRRDLILEDFAKRQIFQISLTRLSTLFSKLLGSVYFAEHWIDEHRSFFCESRQANQKVAT